MQHNTHKLNDMKEIEFKHATLEGAKTSKGELIEHNGFQYALHNFEDSYDAIELSTGFRVAGVASVAKTVNRMPARDYLILQIKEKKITPRVLELAKLEMEANNIEFPLNNRF